MGSARLRPARLAEKLLRIRTALGISQQDLFNRLRVEHLIDYTKISTYETGKREPPLPILLQYARVANVLMEVLADDELDLPETLPSPTRSEGVRRTPAARSKKR
jgi:transcriptional regulator with XRE-family HTH domain